MVNNYLVGGFNPPEKYDFVSWDDDIPNIWKIIQMFQTTIQIWKLTRLPKILSNKHMAELVWLWLGKTDVVYGGEWWICSGKHQPNLFHAKPLSWEYDCAI